MGTLYVVGTPIGNLEDLTRRAARILAQVGLVAAEDTRITRRLLSHLDIHTPLLSCNEHNWRERLPRLLEALASGDVALVTDAGMPGVSDPGSEVVAQVAQAGFPVVVVPGVSAVTTALAASGLPGDSFYFLGFLSRRRLERCKQLESIRRVRDTLIVLEAPHRLRDTLQDLQTTLGERQIAVCREVTKLHEEVFRGSINQASQHFDAPRGEFVLVIQGANSATPEESAESENIEAARQQLTRLRQAGAGARDAVSAVAEAQGLPRNAVYQLWLQLKPGAGD